MADRLIFPIGFDLDSAVKKAEKDWDGTYASRLEKAIQKRALAVKLKFDTSKLDNLDAVRQRLAQLKIEPITPETKTAIRELARELQSLAKALEQVQKFSTTSKLGQQNFRNDVAIERLRQANERLEIQKRRVALAEQKHAEAMRRSATASQQLSKEYRNQDGYISRLIKRLAVYAGFQQITGFLRNVREVTAEFELQRVSLGAIIQDQTRANALFSEIKQFALKSPISIMDLTKYTKQVAAYKIETDKLFDTTKRLADVSVGLGVDMGRIVLAYGQVKAASYLRAAEIRQFTEAGIPMLELLAEKFTELNGEAVTTEQVMEMVSKRMVSFSMVEDIFNDMTSAGGMFYNMQEKQGNTLYGMWAKLGDAASMMYDEVGNTDSVNAGMKSLIQLLTDLMRNWKAVAKTAMTMGGLTAAAATGFYLYTSVVKANTLATKANALASIKMRLETIKSNSALSVSYKTMRMFGVSTNKATAYTIAFSRALRLIKAISFGLIITGVTLLVEKFWEARENVNKLKDALKDIQTEGFIESEASVSNFKRLAKAITDAADGSNEQSEALDELKRTYKEMMPVQDLTVEKLKSMNGNYTELTQSIREYIAMKTKEKEANKISELYGTDIADAERELFNKMEGRTIGGITFDNNNIRFFIDQMRDIAEEGGLSFIDAINETFRRFGSDVKIKNLFELPGAGGWGGYDNALTKLFNLTKAMNREIENLDARYTKTSGAVGIFSDQIEALNEHMKEYANTNNLDESKLLDNKRLSNERNLEILRMIINAVPELKGKVEDFARVVKEFDESAPFNTTLINFDKLGELLNSIPYANDSISELKKNLSGDGGTTLFDAGAYGVNKFRSALLGASPALKMFFGELNKGEEIMLSTNPEIAQSQLLIFQLAKEHGVAAEDIERYMRKNGESAEDYVNRLEQALLHAKGRLGSLAAANDFLSGGQSYILAPEFLDKEKNKEREKQTQAEISVYRAMIDEMKKRMEKDKKSSASRAKSDNRLSILQEMVSTLKQVNKEYDELAKKEGTTKALADTREKYANTFKYLQSLAARYKFKLPDFGVPTDAAALTKYLKAIKTAMAKLPESQKAVLSLETDIADINMDESQKKIEAQLKELADKISRTKTAREFYDKVLGMTGDVELAANVSLQIYGSNGMELDAMVKEQFRKAFESIGNDNPELVTEVNSIIDRGAYEELREYLDKLPEDARKTAEDLVKAQQQMSAKQYDQWLKDLGKAKDYADKRIELSRYTANQIEAIEKRIAKLDPAASDYDSQKAMLEKLIQDYKDREDKEAAKIEYDMFKDMPIYVQMFDNLDNASSNMLNNMLNLLKKNKAQWAEFLDPTQLKEMQGRMNEIEKQLAARNPFKTLGKALKEWWTLKKSGRNRKDDEDAATAAIEREAAAYEKWVKADKAYQAALKSHGNDTKNEEVIAAKGAADAAEKEYKDAKKASGAAQKQASAWKDIADAIDAANDKIDEYQEKINKALDEVLDMMETLGVDAVDMEFFNSMKEGFNQILDGSQAAATAFGQFATGKYFEGAMSSVSAITGIVSGISNLFSAGKVRKANKEIKKQDEVLEQLEYSYNRLQEASDKLFGKDYLQNYNQQIENLEAQQQAYLKQAEAERSKGKKADEEKIKEYENAARETANEIKKMQDDLVAHFTGQDQSSMARDFATAWLEAKASFASTTDAIKSKYKDMIKSMIVEGAAAKIIDNALAPLWKQMDDMLGDGNIDGAIDAVVNGMDRFITSADDGLNVLWKSLEAKGYDMQKLLGDTDTNLTGISRDIASASEESINGLAAGINTQNYYISYVPQISQNVAAMRVLLEAGSTVFLPSSSAAWTDWQQQAMDNLNGIRQNTSEILVQCRRSADACNAAAENLRRVIVPRGSKGTHGVQVYM